MFGNHNIFQLHTSFDSRSNSIESTEKRGGTPFNLMKTNQPIDGALDICLSRSEIDTAMQRRVRIRPIDTHTHVCCGCVWSHRSVGHTSSSWCLKGREMDVTRMANPHTYRRMNRKMAPQCNKNKQPRGGIARCTFARMRSLKSFLEMIALCVCVSWVCLSPVCRLFVVHMSTCFGCTTSSAVRVFDCLSSSIKLKKPQTKKDFSVV